MKLKLILMLSLFVFSCKKKETARLPEPKAPIEESLEPINAEIISKAVLYEANIRQYSNEGSFNAFAEDLPVLKKMGVKIIWLMLINPISTTKSKGPLGSYYAVSDYTKVNPEFGSLADFKSLVNKAHELGMYVILDWVPGHTGWDHVWIKEHSDYYLKNRRGEIIDPIDFRTGKSFGWTDVADLNYDNLEMREALRQAMVYWVRETAIDGYRIDQAYAVPQEFYDKTFEALKAIKPVFLLAETDIYHPGGLELVSKFDASYDWPGYQLSKEIAQGRKNASDFSRHVLNTIRRYGPENIVVNFVTNHDENSWNGTLEESYGAAAEVFMALDYTLPGMPLIYSGQEYDLNKRLRFFEKDSFPKTTGKTMELLQQLGALKNNHPALESGAVGGSFEVLPTSKPQQVFAFKRGKEGDTLVVMANLSKEYAQFTMPYDGNLKRYFDFKAQKLSTSYQYDMKPWEFWILLKE
jgi:alpha-amylase